MNSSKMDIIVGDRYFSVQRVFDAPISLVWKAYTLPEYIAQWWGPDGFTNTISKMDVVPGGVWEFVMHGPDGTDYRNKHVYIEVIHKQKLVMEHVTGPKFITTIQFIAEGGKTLVDWHMLFQSAEELQRTIKVFHADEGLKQNLEKLEKYLNTIQNV